MGTDEQKYKPLSFVERRSISKLRLGILPLRLETARYLRPILPEKERVCYCNSGEIESEFYVLFICTMYHDLRQTWLENLCIPENFNSLPINEKLKLVLNEAKMYVLLLNILFPSWTVEAY